MLLAVKKLSLIKLNRMINTTIPLRIPPYCLKTFLKLFAMGIPEGFGLARVFSVI